MQRDTWIQDPNYNAVLPASGAYSDQAYTPITGLASGVPNFPRELTIAFSYLKAAAASSGQPKFEVQWEINGVGGYYEMIAVGTPTTSGSVATTTEYISETKGLANTSATVPVLWKKTIAVPAAASGVRVLVAEVGDTTHPGTLTVSLALRGAPN
jgi:hypothetical protein